MTTIYVPRLIESAEQAEALPVGTVLLHLDSQGGVDQAGVVQRGHVEYSGVREEFPDEMAVGDLALVPIEAEEETKSADHYRGPVVVRTQRTLTRLVTPWEEA